MTTKPPSGSTPRIAGTGFGYCESSVIKSPIIVTLEKVSPPIGPLEGPVYIVRYAPAGHGPGVRLADVGHPVRVKQPVLGSLHEDDLVIATPHESCVDVIRDAGETFVNILGVSLGWQHVVVLPVLASFEDVGGLFLELETKAIRRFAKVSIVSYSRRPL